MSRSKDSVNDQQINSDTSFVTRWSRLKHETRQGSEHAAAENKSQEKQSLATDVLNDKAKTAVKILTDDDMPAIESLTPDSNYTDFLSPGVSEKLRKLALRKLFHGEAFNICDGLDEYADDYTQFEALGDLMTADMKHQLELKLQRQAEQMLQQETALPDDKHSIEQSLVNGDSVDANNITALQQNRSQPPLDETETRSAAESSFTVAAGTQPDVKANKVETEDVEVDDMPAKKRLHNELKHD